MELALTETCQILRRAGKRFVSTKLTQSGSYQNTNENSVTHETSGNVDNNASDKVVLFKKLINTTQPRSLAFSNTHHLQARNIFCNKFKVKAMPPNTTSFFGCKKSYLDNRINNHCINIPSYIPSRYFSTNSEFSHWISSLEIENLLIANKLPYKKGYSCFKTICKKCMNNDLNEKELLTNLINMRTGDVLCKLCGEKTQWNIYKNQFALSSETKNNESKILTIHSEKVNPLVHELWLESCQIDQYILDLLPDKFSCISRDIFKSHGVRFSHKHNCLIYPYYDITKQKLTGFKTESINSQDKEIYSQDEYLSLFNWKLINDEEKTIILTCNEIDCLAISEVLDLPSACLPYGVNSLPPTLLPFLEQFDKIIFWFDNGYRARQNLHTFAGKLSLSRCHVVNSGKKGGPFDTLLNEGDHILKQVLNDCKSLSHDHIVTFKEIVDEVYSELINSKENAGVQFHRFPVLNEYLEGHRRGELSIFTGPTGSGKTTFLSELSLDLCMQGVRTLWGSFEIKNPRLVNMLMHQYSGLPLENHMEQFSKWSHKFQMLPFYFMTYYGAQDLQQVLNTIEYAIFNYDVEHIVIDNLQFMVSLGSNEDRFLVMDRAISSFRKCASNNNVHITLVVHPRKENDGSSLQTSSIFGSAKASQEADNVLILQSSEDLCMQISKNRFSGTIGTIPLKFHPHSLCLSGFHRNISTDEEILPLLKPKRPIQNIKVIKKDKK